MSNKNWLKKIMGLEISDDINTIPKETGLSEKGKARKYFKAIKNKINWQKIFGYSWPFIVLILIFAFGWQSLKPYIRELTRKTGMISESLFGEEEKIQRDPDEEYEFYENQAGLRPARREEIEIAENFLALAEIPDGLKVNSAIELKNTLDSAAAGSVIVLEAGEYALNLEIDKDITIYGQGSSTVLKAVDKKSPVIKISQAAVTLKNLSISGSRLGVDASQSSIKIERVKFTGLIAMALWVKESELDLKNSYIYESGQGIGALNSSGRIKDSIIQNSKKSGIELLNSDFRVSGNIIENNGSYGVFADQSSKAEIEGNYIEGNKGFNVRAEGRQEIYR